MSRRTRKKTNTKNQTNEVVPDRVQAFYGLQDTLIVLCDPDNQPHPWIGKPDLLGEVIASQMLAVLGISKQELIKRYEEMRDVKK